MIGGTIRTTSKRPYLAKGYCRGRARAAEPAGEPFRVQGASETGERKKGCTASGARSPPVAELRRLWLVATRHLGQLSCDEGHAMKKLLLATVILTATVAPSLAHAKAKVQSCTGTLTRSEDYPELLQLVSD